ncbi:hypothetical protein [Zobellia galactanivorans]|uniref:hypothetical protein n=1 Tax=Zobellia galactanivorans (strain DSM 12802 / CCUG 47099 / CIP 106680 / NCIMB 13871 / Dsij) TaxID=63186 RepID=UPI001C070D58|nr:hypothetical protein [Zobellia galactanivorans]MBU3027903.1 hypothetical protein [Zobellia galactanivorans]
MFPLNIKYNRKLNKLSESNQILDLIEKELIRLKIDKIQRSELKINFKNSFFNGQGRWHLMAPIDKGYLKLDGKSNNLEYSFSVIRTFYISLAFSLLFGLISQSYKFGIIIFLWFFGMNWIITLIRQNLFMNRLKSKIIERNTTHNKELR